MKIKRKHLERWAADSLAQAIKLGYPADKLTEILQKTKFTVLPGFPPEGIWYGNTSCSKEFPEILVYQRNLSTEGAQFIKVQLEAKNIPKKLLSPVVSACRVIPDKVLFEVIGQSGMDHEFIGHLCNFLLNKEYDERAACTIEIQLARKRGGVFKPHWSLIGKLAPIILAYHKSDFYLEKV